MESIFISSRMHELSIERRIAFNTLTYLGYRTLMFETEPIFELKSSLDNMMDVSNLFVGFYFKTFGLRNPELFKLTPIEYELLYFVKKQCPENNKNISKNCNGKCLENINRIIQGKELKVRINPSVSEEKKDKEIIRDCNKAIKKAEKRTILFFKNFNDERALSPQLQMFIQNLQNIGFSIVDFDDEWDLSNKLVQLYSLPKLKNKSLNNSVTSFYKIEFKGLDQPKQLNKLLKFAFDNHLNIDALKLNTINSEKERKTNIEISCTDFSLIDKPRSKKLQTKLKTFQTNTFIGSTKKNLFNEEIRIKTVKNDVNQINIKKYLENMRMDDFINDTDKECLIIRIYHLDVPGVVYNITRVLTGDSQFNSIFSFNIERAWVKNRSSSFYAMYRKPEDVKNENNKAVGFNYHNEQYHQITELLLTFEKNNNKINSDIGNEIILENSINSIIGVFRVIISKNLEIKSLA